MYLAKVVHSFQKPRIDPFEAKAAIFEPPGNQLWILHGAPGDNGLFFCIFLSVDRLKDRQTEQETKVLKLPGNG